MFSHASDRYLAPVSSPRMVASLTVKGALSSAATTCSHYVQFSQGHDQLRSNHAQVTFLNWVKIALHTQFEMKSSKQGPTEHLQVLICMLSLVGNANKQAHSTTFGHNSA